MTRRFLLAASAVATSLSFTLVASAQPMVSGPLVLGPPVSDRLTFASVSGLAFGANEYMAAWTANSGSGIAVRSFDKNGAPLGDTPTFIGEAGLPALAFDGTNFRAFWTLYDSSVGLSQGIQGSVVSPGGALLHSALGVATTQVTSASAACASTGTCAVVTFGAAGVIGVRFDANGDPIDVAPLPLAFPGDTDTPYGTALQIAHIASGYVVVWGYSPSPCRLQVLSPSLTPVGAPVTLGDATGGSCVVGGRDDRVLVAWSEQQVSLGALSAMRFDGSGTPIDAAPLSLGTTLPPTSVAATSGGFAITTNSAELEPGTDATVVQLDASGAVQSTTSLPVAGDEPGELWEPVMASDGTNLFIAGNTGGRISGTDVGDPTDTPRRMVVDPSGALSLPAAVLSTVYEMEWDPDPAWNGSAFLATFAQGNPLAIDRAQITPAGQVHSLPAVQTASIPTAGLWRVALASNGTGYGVVSGGASSTYVAVAPSATGIPSTSTIAGQGGSEADVSIASDGQRYLAVYGYEDQLSGYRPWVTQGLLVDAAGNTLVTIPVATTAYEYGVASVAWSGSTYVVTWLDDVQPASEGPTFQDAQASFYDANGALVGGPVSVSGVGPGTPTSGSVKEVSLACGPSSCVFAFSSAEGISTRRFSANGASSAVATPLTNTAGFRAPSIAWDGQEYVLAAAATKVGPADLVATWLDANGQVIGGGFTTVASGALGSTVPLRITADQARHALLSYTRFQDRLAVGYQIEPTPAEAPDAGPSPEAGPPALVADAGGDSSAPNDDAAAGSSSGCGCSVPADGTPLLPSSGAALLTLLVVLRRRRGT